MQPRKLSVLFCHLSLSVECLPSERFCLTCPLILSHRTFPHNVVCYWLERYYLLGIPCAQSLTIGGGRHCIHILKLKSVFSFHTIMDNELKCKFFTYFFQVNSFSNQVERVINRSLVSYVSSSTVPNTTDYRRKSKMETHSRIG